MPLPALWVFLPCCLQPEGMDLCRRLQTRTFTNTSRKMHSNSWCPRPPLSCTSFCLYFLFWCPFCFACICWCLNVFSIPDLVGNFPEALVLSSMQSLGVRCLWIDIVISPLPLPLHFQHLGRAGRRVSGLYADGRGWRGGRRKSVARGQKSQQQIKGKQVTDRLKLKYNEGKPKSWMEKAQLGICKLTEILLNLRCYLSHFHINKCFELCWPVLNKLSPSSFFLLLTFTICSCQQTQLVCRKIPRVSLLNVEQVLNVCIRTLSTNKIVVIWYNILKWEILNICLFRIHQHMEVQIYGQKTSRNAIWSIASLENPRSLNVALLLVDSNWKKTREVIDCMHFITRNVRKLPSMHEGNGLMDISPTLFHYLVFLHSAVQRFVLSPHFICCRTTNYE